LFIDNLLDFGYLLFTYHTLGFIVIFYAYEGTYRRQFERTDRIAERRDADLVATLIKENTKAVNQGEYSEAELEMLCAFAAPETIQQEVTKGFLVSLFFSDRTLSTY